MLRLSWISASTPDPATECNVLATRLPLRTYRDLPRLLWWSARITRRLSSCPGLLGHAFALQVGDRSFWTVSAWARRGDLARFDRTETHRAAKARLRPTMLPSTIVIWTCPAGELPIHWHEVRRRIAGAAARRELWRGPTVSPRPAVRETDPG